MKKAIKILGVLVGLLVITAVGYVTYMQINYYRIEDNKVLTTTNNTEEVLEVGKDYSAVTYNIGFGAYDKDYSFFMDKGVMKDGTKVVGASSRAASKSSVVKNTGGSLGEVQKLNADFVLLQEVDEEATRSYGINQKQIFENGLSGYGSTFALNFHSPYMIYPFKEPHGSVKAGMQTLSRYSVASATRRSYPVDNSFFTKFFDLDRCFIITRIPTSNDKELVLINTHMSAYDEGGNIRVQQLELLNKVMEEEYKKGNYVIAGGDFNHALNINLDTFKSEQEVPEWVFQLKDEDLAAGMKIVDAKNNKSVPTCRSCDIAYKKEVNYTSVLDGFIVSENVDATAENIDMDFMYSDHNPVKITFRLKK